MKTAIHDRSVGQRPLSATVYQRIDPPTVKAADEIVARLEELHKQGLIDDFDHVTVPARVYDTPGTRSTPEQVVDELLDVAHRLDVTLAPALQRRDRYNWYTNEVEIVLTLPIVTLVVRDGQSGSALAMAPVIEGDHCHCVGDLLDDLQTDRL